MVVSRVCFAWSGPGDLGVSHFCGASFESFTAGLQGFGLALLSGQVFRFLTEDCGAWGLQ